MRRMVLATRVRVALLAMVVAMLAQPLSALTLTADDIGTSARVPSVGRAVTFTVRLRAEKTPLSGEFRVCLDAAPSRVAEKTVRLNLAAGQHADVPLVWTPRADGWHRLVFRVFGGGNSPVAQIEQDTPVTFRPLTFLWFGAPKTFKWCNMPTTVEPKDRDWWLWRGATPCTWKGGVCYKEWSVEQFAKSYNDWPWIAVDEIGPDDDTGRKIIAAVRAHKRAHPEGCRALWYMGVHDHWRQVRDAVDLFVPEIYLNYGANHLGRIDDYVRRTRQVGCMDRMIPGLGINVVEDNQKRPIVTPTRADVLRQIRHLKTIAPELPGVGFFTSMAAPGVAEYADALCRDYYIEPVLTLAPDSLRASAAGQTLRLTATVRNHGGMTARDGAVEFGEGIGPAFRAISRHTLAPLAPLGEAMVTASAPRQTGVHCYTARLVTSPGRAALNESLSTVIAQGLPAQSRVVYQPPAETPGDSMPLFAEIPADATITAAAALDANGRAINVVAATVLPGLPGDAVATLTWTPKSTRSAATAEGDDLCGMPSRRSGRVGMEGEKTVGLAPLDPPYKTPPYKTPPCTTLAVFELSARAASDAPALRSVRNGNTLQVSAAGYVTVLDLAKDEVRSLKTRPDGPELLGSPWAFSCSGCTGVQAVQVKELPGGLLVTIPFANPQAEGFSRYFFYAAAAVVRIERYFKPHGVVKLTACCEGCGMPQRGGVYAAQAGVGGEIRRGKLRDSSDYSDLLFGYVGASPGPENARLAGWFDCAFTRDGGGGLGVAIQRRWEDVHSDVGYDVTRYYDGSDGIQLINLWGKEMTVRRPQTQIVYLLPHGPLALDQESVVGPAQRLWTNVHTPARAAIVVR